MRLQLFGHRESRYERPTLNYCCGGEVQCTLGPDAAGGCQAGPMCQPVKVGGLYKCARSPVAGGPCEPGPGPAGQCGCVVPPCVPQPTLRARRMRIARWSTLVAVAVVLIALSVSSRGLWLAGPLSAGHSEVGECSQCHANADASASVWLHQALTPTDPVAASESCTACHDRGGPSLALAPHNQPPEVLQHWRETGTSRENTGDGPMPAEFMLASAVFGPARAGDGEPVACATCHQEHRGGADFTAMSDAGCQSCHAVKFDGFPDDHPAFDGYPYRERQEIAFNHASHFDRHFPNADAAMRPENCTSCHTADSVGRGMLTTGYESSCASCHDGDIRKGPASGPPGGPFLAVPGLDLETLAAEGVAVGFWPDSFYDRGVPPVMQALLSLGYMEPAELALLQEVDLLDLTEASAEVLEAVAALAWATKAMLADMLQEGVLGDAGMMRETFGVRLDAAQISRLGGSVPRDVLSLAADSWFGCTLYTEVAAYRAGEPPATLTLSDHVDGKPPACVETAPDAMADAAADASADASADAAGDDVAPSALDALAGSPLGGDSGGDILGGSGSGGGGDILGGSGSDGGGDILGGSGSGSGGDILGGSGSDGGGDILGSSGAGGDGDILGGSGSDGGGDILGSSGSEGGGDILGDSGTGGGGGDIFGGSGSDGGGDILGSSGSGGGGDILGGSGSGSGGDILGGSGAGSGGGDSILGGIGSDAPAPDDPSKPDAGPAVIEPEPVDPAEWARHGGWYRTAEAVYYRPVEHADRFLHAWLDFAGAAYGTPNGAVLGEAIFDAMGQPTSLGRCAKCHGAERQADGSVAINWQAGEIDPAESRVTEFRHAPHLTIAGDQGCNLCHEVRPGDAMMASFQSLDATDFTPGFTAMTKDTCATCHAKTEAASECQHCHNYHVGVFSNARRMGELTTTGTAAGGSE